MRELNGRMETLKYLYCNYFNEDCFSVDLSNYYAIHNKLYMPKGKNNIYRLAFEGDYEKYKRKIEHVPVYL